MLQLRCVVSSATGTYHLVLVDKRRMAKSLYCFGGAFGTSLTINLQRDTSQLALGFLLSNVWVLETALSSRTGHFPSNVFLKDFQVYLFYWMCVSVLFPCIHVHHLHTCCLQRSEKGIGTGLTHGCELLCMPGPLQEQVLLTLPAISPVPWLLFF